MAIATMAPQAASIDDNNKHVLGGSAGIFMECVVYGLEHTVDLLGCDEQAVRRQFEEVSNLQSQASKAPEWTKRDYAKLHDEFVESLLQEQENATPTSSYTCTSSREEEEEVAIPPTVLTSSSSTSSSLSDARPVTPTGDSFPFLKPHSPRRRRPLKLSRRSPTKNRNTSKRKILPLPLHSRDDDDLSLVSQITKRSLPHPTEYLLAGCRLQKDKGKGEPIGSNICATTREACLEKLRSKMELLTQHASSKSTNKKKSTSMKRRKAKVTEETLTYTETRSVMDLRMGFLSMQYGVLLRWDTKTTGKVVLVVLRKMAQESFYRKDCMQRQSIRYQQVMPECHDGNHVVMIKPDGTEVTLLGEPYRVERPITTAPAVLELKVLRLNNFSEQSTWTVQVAIEDGDGESQKSRCQLQYGIIQPILPDQSLSFELKENVLHMEVSVQIYEQKKPRQKRKRLVSQETLCLDLLDVSRHHLLEIPEYGTILFQVALQSAYVHWLQSELQARQQTVVESNVFYPVYTDSNRSVARDEDDGLWEMCCL